MFLYRFHFCSNWKLKLKDMWTIYIKPSSGVVEADHQNMELFESWIKESSSPGKENDSCRLLRSRLGVWIHRVAFAERSKIWSSLNHKKFFKRLYLKLKDCLKWSLVNAEETSKKQTQIFWFLRLFNPELISFEQVSVVVSVLKPDRTTSTARWQHTIFIWPTNKHEHEAFNLSFVVFLKQLRLWSDPDRGVWVSDCLLNKTTYLNKITSLTFYLQNDSWKQMTVCFSQL